jgi:hypothetical protein
MSDSALNPTNLTRHRRTLFGERVQQTRWNQIGMLFGIHLTSLAKLRPEPTSLTLSKLRLKNLTYGRDSYTAGLPPKGSYAETISAIVRRLEATDAESEGPIAFHVPRPSTR